MASSTDREFVFTWDDFNRLRTRSNSYSGIQVPDEKFDLFYSRLSRRLRELGLADFSAYCDYLERYPEQEMTEFINSITTNLTAFFREKHHFDFLADSLLAELLQKNKARKQIRAWSSACSTGEEAYSIAMVVKEFLPEDWSFTLLATDLDTRVLAQAQSGIYSREGCTSIGSQCLQRWFVQGKGGQAGKIKVKPELSLGVHFKQLNLIQEWPISLPFDFIFCRNVFIYFDLETKRRLVNRFAQFLPVGGHLFIGHSESLQQLSKDFTLVGQTLYRKL